LPPAALVPWRRGPDVVGLVALASGRKSPARGRDAAEERDAVRLRRREGS